MDINSYAMEHESCDPITYWGQDTPPLPEGHAFQVRDPDKRLIDPRPWFTPVIFRDGNGVSNVEYIILFHAGVIVFREPVATDAAIAIDGGYIRVRASAVRAS